MLEFEGSAFYVAARDIHNLLAIVRSLQSETQQLEKVIGR
jgi:hypothetical protein